MFDKELLVNSPAVVSELNWGGVCIDLLQNSLEVDIDTLLDSWLHVMKYLEPAQVMAIPSFGDNGRGYSSHLMLLGRDHLKG